MTQRYYKSTAPAVISAVKQFAVDEEALLAAADKFAEFFGGKAMFGFDLHRVYFAGLRFYPEKSTDLFTAANSQSAYVQQPRDRLKSPINKELKEPHKKLKADWQEKRDELFPNGKEVKCDAKHEAIGFDWGIALFSGGSYLVFEHEGVVYATCAQELNDSMVEITGSEFDQARQAAAGVQRGAV